MAYTVLIIDDEQETTDLVEAYLQNEGYLVLKAYTAAGALTILEEKSISMVILDVMLPDLDGYSLCQKIREHHLFPILMLSARTKDTDRIMGLTLGADDYMTKPFSPLELVARVKTQLRRYTKYNLPDFKEKEYHFNGLAICHSRHLCTLNGKPLALTPIEFNILWYLCVHRGMVISSEELFEAVWQEKYMDNHNTIMAHIARLREKMGDSSRTPRFIRTVWGVGYSIK